MTPHTFGYIRHELNHRRITDKLGLALELVCLLPTDLKLLPGREDGFVSHAALPDLVRILFVLEVVDGNSSDRSGREQYNRSQELRTTAEHGDSPVFARLWRASGYIEWAAGLPRASCGPRSSRRGCSGR